MELRHNLRSELGNDHLSLKLRMNVIHTAIPPFVLLVPLVPGILISIYEFVYLGRPRGMPAMAHLLHRVVDYVRVLKVL